MSDFPQNGYILVTASSKKLVFGLNDGEYIVSHLSLIHYKVPAANKALQVIRPTGDIF